MPSNARSTTAPVAASALSTVTAERPRTKISPAVAASAPVSMSCTPLVAPSPARRQIAEPLQGSVSGASLAAPAVMPCRSSEPSTLCSCTKPPAAIAPEVSVPPACRSISLTPPTVPIDMSPDDRPYSSPVPVMSPTVTAPAIESRSMFGAVGGVPLRDCVRLPAVTPVRPYSASWPSVTVTSPSASAPCDESTNALRTASAPLCTPVLPCSVRSVSLVSAWPVQVPLTSAPRHTLPSVEDSCTDCGVPPIWAAPMPTLATPVTFKARPAVRTPVARPPSAPVAVRATSRCAVTSPSANPLPTSTASWAPEALPAVTVPALVSTMPEAERISTRPAAAVTAPPVVTPSRPSISTSPTVADTAPVVSVRPLPSTPSNPAPRQTALPSQGPAALTEPPALMSPSATLPRLALTRTWVVAVSAPASTPSRPSSETRPDRAVTAPAAKPSSSTPILTLPASARTSTSPAVTAAKEINAPCAVSTFSLPPTAGSSPSDSSVPATIEPDFERSSSSATCGVGASTRACETSPASTPSRPSSSTVPSRAVMSPMRAVNTPSPSVQGSEPAGGADFVPAWMSTRAPSTSRAATLPAAARKSASPPAVTAPTSIPSWPRSSIDPARSRSATLQPPLPVTPTHSAPPVETSRRLSGSMLNFSTGSNSSLAALVIDTWLLGAKAEMRPKLNFAGSVARDSSVSAWMPSSPEKSLRVSSPTEMPRPFSEMFPADTVPG